MFCPNQFFHHSITHFLCFKEMYANTIETIVHIPIQKSAAGILTSCAKITPGISRMIIAIAPVIAVVSRIKKGYWLALIFTVIYSFAGLFTSISDVLSACYPITATFNISGYYSATFGEIIISLMSLFFCGLFSVLILISKKTIKNK